MVILKKYQNKKIAVYGMGKTGYSAAKTLKKLKAKTFCWDDNKKIRDNIKFFFKLNKFWLKKDTIDYILISPGIDIHKCKIKKFLLKNKKKIITDLDLFFEMNKNELIISITGTNGKSTTCKILEKILKTAKYNVKTLGNIGNPILSYKKDNKKYVFILEVSSYQLQYSKVFRSNHAAILNISPDHLERHGSINNYVKAKFKLIKNQNDKDFAFLNTRNKYLKKEIKKNKIFSKIVDVNFKKFNNLRKKINNPYFLTLGNQENLSFIFALTLQLKLKIKKIVETINKFKGLEYRQEIVYKDDKVTVINDSKATSFASSINILRSLKTVLWLVGGESKLGDKFTLKNSECKNIKAYIFGKKKNFFIKQFRNKLSHYYSFNDLKSAVKHALNDLSKNNLKKTILFSPSAASFDNFKNFEERGAYFNYLIKKYKF